LTTFTVLGAGMMGSAFCVPLHDQGHRIHLVGTHLDHAIIESLRSTRIHPTLGVEIPAGVEFHHLEALGEVCPETDWIILGVNSRGIQWAADQLQSLIQSEAHIVFLTKGLTAAENGLLILPEFFRNLLPAELGKSLHLYAIGGPSIAGELARRQPTSVVLTARDDHRLRELADLIQNPYYWVHTSSDINGVEFCVALKNLYSVGVGMAQALGDPSQGSVPSPQAHNPAAAVYAQSLAEMIYLVSQNSGNMETTTWLAGAGDLYVTCQGGRNSRFGRQLGSGKSLDDVRDHLMKGETIEGYEVALAIGQALRAQIRNGKLAAARLPLLTFLLDVMLDSGPVSIPWTRFHGWALA
jgi:glycerol-3-phosphate dehydrogenase (NAD(P)+)